MDINKIYVGNNIEVMKEIKNYSIQLALTDPPYNLGIDYGEYYDDNKTYDEYFDWCKEWFKVLYSKVIDKVVFTPGNKNLAMWFDIMKPTVISCWHRPNTRTSVNLGLLNNWEPILIYSKTKKKVNALRDYYSFYVEMGICRSFQKDVKEHYCPKPIELWKALVLDYSNPGDTVIDPFMGSGTTAVACIETGRNFIGIDINPKFVDMAYGRVNKAKYVPQKIKYGTKSLRI